MQPAFSNNLISSLMNIWYFNRIGYGLCGVCGPMVRISFWKRFVLPTSIGDLKIMLLFSHSSKEDRPSLAFCGMWASCKTIEWFVLVCSGRKLHSGSMHGNSIGLFHVSAVPSVVHEMLLTLKSSMSIGCKLPVMVFLRMWTMLCSVLCRDYLQ